MENRAAGVADEQGILWHGRAGQRRLLPRKSSRPPSRSLGPLTMAWLPLGGEGSLEPYCIVKLLPELLSREVSSAMEVHQPYRLNLPMS